MVTNDNYSKRAFLFAFTDNSLWGNFSQLIAPELLPVANRPFLEWIISRLVDNGFKEIHFYVSEHASQFFELLGNGQRWGVNLSFSAVIDEKHALKRLQREFEIEGGLIVDCSIIPWNFAFSLENLNYCGGFWGISELEEGWVYLCDDIAMKVARNQELMSLRALLSLVLSENNLRKYNSEVFSCRSSLELLKLNSVLISTCEYKDYVPGNEVEDSVFLDSGVILHPTAKVNSIAAIGEYSSLGRGSCLYSNTSVGRNCRIGDMTKLKNAIVLDNTVLGENLCFENCIVSGNRMIRSGSSVDVLIPDRFIAGSKRDYEIGDIVAKIGKYAALMLVLPIALPVYLIIYGLLRISGIEKPVYEKKVVSVPSLYVPELYNTFLYREFVQMDDNLVCSVFKCRILKRLPTLVNLFADNVDWFGVKERSLEEFKGMSESDLEVYLLGRVGIFRLSELDWVEYDEELSENVSESYFILNASAKLKFDVFFRYLKRLFII